MELIQKIFEDLQADINKKISTVEKTIMVYALANEQSHSTESFAALKQSMDTVLARMTAMENRLATLEKRGIPPSTPAAVASAALEGLLMKPISLPSPVLAAKTENQVVVPIIQRQVVLEKDKEEEVEPDEDAIRGVVAEQVGGIDEEEDAVEEEEEEEGQLEQEEEEEEEGETIELTDFIWKGKTYYKTPDNFVYRVNEDGEVEDEPFAEYNPKTNTLKRI